MGHLSVKCPNCNFYFSSAEKLRKHRMKLHKIDEKTNAISAVGLANRVLGEKEYLCPSCLIPYMTPQGLLMHIKYFHPELIKCFVNTSIGASCIGNMQFN